MSFCSPVLKVGEEWKRNKIKALKETQIDYISIANCMLEFYTVLFDVYLLILNINVLVQETRFSSKKELWTSENWPSFTCDLDDNCVERGESLCL